jgi:hypothetical protein
MSIASLADVVEELNELKRGFDAWASLSSTRRSGTPALELIEAPLRAFFGKASPDGIITGKGDRPAEDSRYSSDMDIVLDLKTATWVAQLRMEVLNSPVLAHLDVSARADWDSKKLASDLARLQRTTDEARAKGRKTWTGLVAIGSGFQERSADVIELLHSFHHERDLGEWTSSNAGNAWPFIDAVVVPGMCLKKHDLFDKPDRGARRWPVLYPFPVVGERGLEELWPLVPARAFLASYLRKAVRGESWEAPAWRENETQAVMGGKHLTGAWPNDWRVVALRDDTPLELYHWTGAEQHQWQAHVRHNDRRCPLGRAYSLLPRPSFSMTEERRAEVIRTLQQDLRWSRLLDGTGSRLVAELDFPESLADEVEMIVKNASRLGFKAEAHQRIVKAKGSERKMAITISRVTPESEAEIAELRRVLQTNLGRAVYLDPHVQREALDRWVAEQGWSYDPVEVIAKPMCNALVFAFPERETRQPVVAVVLGDIVERIDDPLVIDTLFEAHE